MATAAEEEDVVPASALRRLSGNKTLEVEIVKGARGEAEDMKNGDWGRRRRVVCDKHRGRRAALSAARRPSSPPEEAVLAKIEAFIDDMLVCERVRGWTRLRGRVLPEGRAPGNREPVPRVMNVHRLLLDGRIALACCDLHWCSDAFEIGRDDIEKMRGAFVLHRCDHEVMGHVAGTKGLNSEDGRDRTVAAVEHRFGTVDRLPGTVERLTDSGSCFIAGPPPPCPRDLSEAAHQPGREPVEQRQGRSLCATFKRDDASVSPVPDARTVMLGLPAWSTL